MESKNSIDDQIYKLKYQISVKKEEIDNLYGANERQRTISASIDYIFKNYISIHKKGKSKIMTKMTVNDVEWVLEIRLVGDTPLVKFISYLLHDKDPIIVKIAGYTDYIVGIYHITEFYTYMSNEITKILQTDEESKLNNVGYRALCELFTKLSEKDRGINYMKPISLELKSLFPRQNIEEVLLYLQKIGFERYDDTIDIKYNEIIRTDINSLLRLCEKY